MASVVLTGCSGAAEETAAPAADDVALEISNARLMLPAVSGNPGAVYFDVTNTGERNYAIRRADIVGASKSELHGSMEMNGQMMMDGVGQVLVEAGGEQSFEPGGFHVMAFDLDPSIAAGGSTEMTLTVVGGKQKTFPVEVRAAGDER
ncbi:copper chaperone PCu(A)C [Qipengyuania sp. 6D47A]|uniref:Copper chaperone PCu(A)C n=2 Tax=Qipengyuania qiaonensis TaxID=2867240 RepID=A0ABS7J5C4_9SPHN|nr:copper chaperone PCu(A)C [Qipengyuania qiaonensis]